MMSPMIQKLCGRVSCRSFGSALKNTGVATAIATMPASAPRPVRAAAS